MDLSTDQLFPSGGVGYMDGEDGATVVTDTIKDDEDRTEPKSCPQQTVKVRERFTRRLY